VALGIDPTLLYNYYTAKLPLSSAQIAASGSQAQANAPTTPWDISIKPPAQQTQDVAVRSNTPYFDPTDLSLLAPASATGTANAQSELAALLNSQLSNASSSSASNASSSSASNATLTADNNKLFGLYNALNRLDYIAQMANRASTLDGQRAGLNQNLQDGLTQILSFVKNASFTNLTVTPGQQSSSEQSAVTIPYPQSNYTGGAVMGDTQVFAPVPGLSTADHFTVSVTKAGVNTNVVIDLSNVTGALNLDNINAYVNQQLGAAGFATRFGRVQTGGDISLRTATWGEQIVNRPDEVVALSSDQAQPAIYVAGMSGQSTDSQGNLIKLVGLSGTTSSAFSASTAPATGTAAAASTTPGPGTAAAKGTAVDANGNVYVIGNTTGSSGSQINQASQDVYLTKYDSAGNMQWTKLLGAADTASAYGLAVDPLSGGVVIAGSVNGQLTPTAPVGGATDSFVAKYDSSGNQTWLRQVAPANSNSANSVSVDSSGNIYVGGQVSGALAAGQTSAGGVDAYITKLDSKGTLVYNRQFGTAGADAAKQTAVASDGNLLVASEQNGHAILTKYDSSNATSPAMWQVDLGDLQGGSIGGMTIASGKVYVSGTTANASLNAGGAASTANASSGGTDGFVFAATDNGASATPDFVSYVGTASAEQGGGVAVAGGKIYLTGTTTGTFAGQTRNAINTHNLFVAQLASDGTLDWAHQYGGIDGESRGVAIASDNSGSSVLDALKLGRGTIDINQSTAITSQTTARVGDYFTVNVQGTAGTRNVQITISPGETMRSLAIKINGALLFDGKATALPVQGGQALKIAVNQGVKVQLIAGPKDFDALAGLGLKPSLLTNVKVAAAAANATKITDNAATNATAAAAAPPITDNANATAAATTTLVPQAIGLGIDSGLDLLSKTTATHADNVLQGAMAIIKQAYGKLNTPPAASSASTTGASVPAYLQAQLAGYQNALAFLNTLTTTGTTSAPGQISLL
jgi:hypothetical protein